MAKFRFKLVWFLIDHRFDQIFMNDSSRWSVKLRNNFLLEIEYSCISCLLTPKLNSEYRSRIFLISFPQESSDLNNLKNYLVYIIIVNKNLFLYKTTAKNLCSWVFWPVRHKKKGKMRNVTQSLMSARVEKGK